MSIGSDSVTPRASKVSLNRDMELYVSLLVKYSGDFAFKINHKSN